MLVKIRAAWNKFIAGVLYERANYVLNKFEPLVIGVTGSVGKTSTKEAIYAVLSSKFMVAKSQGNLNNEIGLPLSIIGSKKPVGVWSWLIFLVTSWWTVRRLNDYPPYLILEMAADKKGDMTYLSRLAKPTVGVVTNVADSHLEFFGSKKTIMMEKRVLVESLPRVGRAILNYDDPLVMAMAKKTRAKVITYGLKKGAMVSAQNIHINTAGTTFKLVYNGHMMPIQMKVVGYSAVYSALAAMAVGLALDMTIIDVKEAIAKWSSVAGRMRILKGKNNILILDDSYNASSKESVLTAFKTIKMMDIGKRRRVGVLGSMWELGKQTRPTHLAVGEVAGKLFDVLIVVEAHALIIKEGAVKSGMKESNIFCYQRTDDLLSDIDQLLIGDDFVFIKGSQGKNRLEKVVRVLLKDKSQAKKLLVRQSKEWL
ncbi:MAG: UDP-N-acetylmuramoyl-tripeptide--D-alanyl-D-alanine ligase [Patescibacteria group bacterium]